TLDMVAANDDQLIVLRLVGFAVDQRSRAYHCDLRLSWCCGLRHHADRYSEIQHTPELVHVASPETRLIRDVTNGKSLGQFGGRDSIPGMKRANPHFCKTGQKWGTYLLKNRVGLDFDKDFRRDQCSNLDHGGSGTDVAKKLSVGAADLFPVCDVGDVHT